MGHDPGYAEPRGDYFTSTYRAIFERDIELMVQMGANTIRLYTFKRSRRHADFLDLAYEKVSPTLTLALALALNR